MGFAFRKGDVPAGASVSGSLGSLQVTPKNTWPDGSLKFAVLAGQVDLPAGTPTPLNLRRASAPLTGTPLNLADLKRTGVTAEVGCGSFGTVSWGGTDWDTPFENWVSGPLMSSWIYRRQVGADAHLTAWLEVRVFAAGAVEVLPWIENGYIAVAAPSNKAATYTFKLAGTERFNAAIDLKHHQRTPLVSGAALSYWNVADPQLNVLHDARYLMSTELVPTYFAAEGAATTVINALPSSFTPLQAGSFNYTSDDMAQSGYQDPIGLLPQHDVLHLLGASMATHAAVVRNGFSAGRYGIHYRDESTNRPLRFSQHPTRVIADGQGFKDNGGSTTSTRTPAATGGNPPGWDVAHSPSVGYLAYLVTGRWYFMEEVLFAATANYLGNGDNAQLRTGARGLVQTAVQAWQTRSCAWDWRSKVQALTVVPDNDTALRTELIACVESNIDHFHGRYVAQPNNPFGYILPGEAYNNSISICAPWQQDFVTAVFGWAVSMDLPVAAAAKTKLSEFFTWKARSAVMRLGDRNGFWYINGAPFNTRISTAALSASNFTTGVGPWAASDAAFYAATYATPPSWLGSTEGTLAFEFQPDYGATARGMWGNLQPAIAYAVRHAVPGARDAYERMTGAANWPSLAAAFDPRPVWSVGPASPAPSWARNSPLNEWVAIPGTNGGGGAAIDAWGTLVLIEGTGTLVSPANGGHNDSADNRVTSIDLLQDAPTWVQRIAPSPTVTANASYMPDGKPVSRHGYHHAHYIKQRGRVMLFGARAWYANGGDGFAVDGHSVTGAWAWDQAGTWGTVAGANSFGVAHDPTTGNVWTNSGRLWNQSSNTWTGPFAFSVSWRWPAVYDPLRGQFFTLQFGDGQGFDLARGVVASKFNARTGAQTALTFNQSAALTQFISDAPIYAGMDYDAANDRFLFYDGRGAAVGRVYAITPNSGNVWDISLLPITGTPPPATVPAGINGRLRYVPALGGFIVMPRADANIFFVRTA
ncbi:hypothetical protein EOE66_04560 [Rubrivivax rivuli]|uniref:Uncharacterized protein n=1 Tax=Rubrivivax rivuli TaxID=1862385 RepID=A0A437RSV0_9BURK|nr:hypothetical protein EOE66_04560 [Rubrivivax rivuli]